MKTSIKIWFIVATSLVVLGAIIFFVPIALMGWDFGVISTYQFETNEHAIDGEFNKISIDTATAKIDFVISDDEECSVVCYESENKRHDVSLKYGVLNITLRDTRKWYEYIGIGVYSPKITVYLPASRCVSLEIDSSTSDIDIPKGFEFGEIEIDLSTGDVSIEGVSAKSIDISLTAGRTTLTDVKCEGVIEIEVSTGKSYLTNVSCADLISDGNTGDMILKDVIASGKFSIERSTGDISFERCDAAEITIETDTGDVKGSLSSGKSFNVRTDTGNVNIPSGSVGGKCNIKTDTGDVKIRID